LEPNDKDLKTENELLELRAQKLGIKLEEPKKETQ
jgi:hypothetical protein